jgi:hypothetical protein
MAERECYARGMEFRGRAYPIYAKEVALKIEAEHMFLEPARVVRVSRLERLSRLSGLSGRSSRSSKADLAPASAEGSGPKRRGSILRLGRSSTMANVMSPAKPA